jgi:hypothetical protein
MHALTRSSVITRIAAAGIGALAVTYATPAPDVHSPPRSVREVQLAASPAPGALLEQFLLNQFQNCAAICPFIVQGLGTVPIGAIETPAALGIVAAQSSASPLQAAGAARQSVAAPAPTPSITVGLPGLNILTKAVGVLTTTAEQTIQVALSLAVGGLVGTPIVLSGVNTALKNLAANGNIGEFLGAALAAENTGFTTAVGVVTSALANARTAILGALNGPPTGTSAPKATLTLKASAPAAANTFTAPTTDRVPRLPTATVKKAVAAVTQVGKSTGDVDGTVAKAGGTAAHGADNTAGTDVKHAGDGSVGKHVK